MVTDSFRSGMSANERFCIHLHDMQCRISISRRIEDSAILFPKRITWNAFYGAGLWAVRERDVLLNDTVRPGKTEKGNLKQDSSKCVEVRDAKMALPLQNSRCVDSLIQLNATLALWLFSQKPYEWQSPQRPRRFPLVHLCLSSAWTNRLSGLWLYYGYSWAWELSWREFDNELLY